MKEITPRSLLLRSRVKLNITCLAHHREPSLVSHFRAFLFEKRTISRQNSHTRERSDTKVSQFSLLSSSLFRRFSFRLSSPPYPIYFSITLSIAENGKEKEMRLMQHLSF